MNPDSSGRQLLPGLVSITFRGLSPEEIIGVAVKAGLSGIEWGGDIHVPHGDLQTARQVARRCADAGLHIPSYGSYYRACDPQSPDFGAVLDTAAALSAGMVRIWAGNRIDSRKVAPSERRQIVQECCNLADAAEPYGILVACEYHGGTLTDTDESALRFLKEVDHPRFKTLWQPPVGNSPESRLAGLHGILPWLVELHVFQWTESAGEDRRRPLEEGKGEWLRYLQVAASAPVSNPGDDEKAQGEGSDSASGQPPIWAMLEFVQNDDPAAAVRDAATLRGMITEIEAG